jgi:uncharacterized protein YbjT (DUF2867 family)
MKGDGMILVTGATGTIGRELVRLLAGDGYDVAAITRNPAAAGLPDDVHVVEADPTKPQTLADALHDAEAIFLNPAAVEGAAEELLALAVEQGVKRAVLLSALSVEYPAGEARFADRFRVLEEAVKASGLEWTFLRSGDFDSNARVWIPQIRGGDVVRGPYGDAATSPIDERDVAAVAARALVEPGHAGKAYVLTGPESLSNRDKVRIVGEAIGRELTFQELTPEQARGGMSAAGVPEEIIDRLLGSQADYAVTPGPTTGTVAELLGRPPLAFADWARDHAAMFRN